MAREEWREDALPSGWWIFPSIVGSIVMWGALIWLMLR
jgi:hypothetical protein